MNPTELAIKKKALGPLTTFHFKHGDQYADISSDDKWVDLSDAGLRGEGPSRDSLQTFSSAVHYWSYALEKLTMFNIIVYNCLHSTINVGVFNVLYIILHYNNITYV